MSFEVSGLNYRASDAPLVSAKECIQKIWLNVKQAESGKHVSGTCLVYIKSDTRNLNSR
jgi:hypothetical protein